MDFSDRKKIIPFDRKLRYGAEPFTRRETKMAAELATILQLVWSARNGNTKFRSASSNREKGPTYLAFLRFPGIFQ